MTIGDRIKKRRNKLDMTPDELADELGKSRATIYRYENGDIKNLPTTILEPLAEALRTTPAYLMGWTDDPHDWERIGNEEGIYLPKDYEGSYENYVKHKIIEESDDLIDSYYDTYENAIGYLKNIGCQIKDIENTDNILVITPTNERLKVNQNDLIYNFMIWGASKPGLKKLIIPRKIMDLRSDEEHLLNTYNNLNDIGRFEAQKRIDELAMIPAYANKNSIVQTVSKPDPELIAAHNDNAEDPEQQRLMSEDIQDMEDNW